jgi:putative transposase
MKDITSNDLNISSRNLPHWQIGGVWYFITFRASTVFSDKARDIAVASILHDHKIKFELSTAVVMPDHVHILFRPKLKGANVYFSLTEIMKPLKGACSRKINALSGSNGSVWQDEWFDRIVRDEKEWSEKHAYIGNNPVKAGLVERPEDYRWLVQGDGFVNQY